MESDLNDLGREQAKAVSTIQDSTVRIYRLPIHSLLLPEIAYSSSGCALIGAGGLQ